MRKVSRLSFRISEELNRRIGISVEQSKGEIKDRSEFGIKAIKFYLDHLLGSESVEERILAAILAIADHAKVNTPDIEKVRELFEKDEVLIETHPNYEGLKVLKEKFSLEIQKEITKKLKKVAYEDLDGVYEYYRQKFYLEGIEQKKALLSEQK